MDNTVYTVDYFIKKFEAIAEGFWITYNQHDDNGNHCALGHCSTKRERKGHFTKEGLALIKLFSANGLMHNFDNKIDPNGQYHAVAAINNGQVRDYPQPTPKQRILAALYDIKAKQQPEVKERIVYVTVDKEVRELQKTELIEN